MKNLPLVNWCCLCRCDEETVDHLLLHCKFAHTLWSEVFLMFGVQWVMSCIVVSLLFAWRNWLGNYSSNVWNMVPVCLMWLEWKECNARTFEDIERPIELLKTSLAWTLIEWSCIWGLTHCISLSDFLISIRFAIWFVCILSLPCVYNRKHIAFLLSIKLLLPIKKSLAK